MPFGAGKTMCPGRYFAKNEIKIPVTLIIRYIEYERLEVNTKPEQMQNRVGVGVVPSKEDIPIRYRYKE